MNDVSYSHKSVGTTIFLRIKPLDLQSTVTLYWNILCTSNVYFQLTDLVSGVVDTICIDAKGCFCFRKARTVINLANTSFSSSFSQIESGSGSMCHNVASNRFLWILSEHCIAVHLSDNLVGDNN